MSKREMFCRWCEKLLEEEDGEILYAAIETSRIDTCEVVHMQYLHVGPCLEGYKKGAPEEERRIISCIEEAIKSLPEIPMD